MNITLMAFGSRGDVQPFLALAVALRERGHQVTLAAPADFEALIHAYGIPYLRIPINNLEVLQRESGVSTRPTFATLRVLFRDLIPEMRRALHATGQLVTQAAQTSDLLISHGFLIPLAYSIHQHLQIPLMLGIAAPIISTKAFPSPMFPPVPFGGRVIYPLSYHLLVRFVTSFMMQPMNTYRKEIGLPTMSAGEVIRVLFSGQIPIAMHYSRYLLPLADDWGANVHVTGAWRLPAPPDWTPPDNLSAFLAQGEPPVYIGFGSMIMPKPERMAQTISDALRLANLRGVLQSGWAGLVHEDEHLITIGDTPHDWLFPRVAAVVHHGGSGTTHSVLSAGKPALIVPFSADQPMWGRRLAELGVNVPPIKPRQLTTARLADALRTLTQDQTMRQRAEEFGVLLSAEDGLTAACELAERATG